MSNRKDRVPHLYRRKKAGVWVYRRRKPVALQFVIGPAPWEESLGPDYLPALDRARALTREHDALIASLGTEEAQAEYLGAAMADVAAAMTRKPPTKDVADQIVDFWSWRRATARMATRLSTSTPPAREAEALRVELAVTFADRTQVEKLPPSDAHLRAVLETVRPEPPPSDRLGAWQWQQAKKSVEERLAEVEKLAPADPGSTITAAMNRYIAFRAVKSETARGYRNRVKAFVKFAGDVQLGRITAKLLRDYRDHLLAEGAVTRTTINQTAQALNAVLEWAAGNEEIAENPNAKVEWPRQDRHVEDTRYIGFTPDQMKIVWAAVESAWGPKGTSRFAADRRAAFWMAFRVLLWTGLRPNEVFLLTPGDVTPAEINVRLTKTGAARDLPLARPIADFHTYMQTQGWPTFTDANSPERTMSESFTRIIRKAGLANPRHTLYSIKDTLLDRLERLGASENIQRSIIGHTSGRGKLRHYKDRAEIETMRGFLDRVSYD